MNIENIMLDNHKARGVFSLAKKIDIGTGYLIFVSGRQAPKGEDGRVVTDDVAQQTRLVFEDINKILNAAGASLDDVVKAVIYLTDLNDFSIISSIRDEYFKNSMPTSTMVEVNRMNRPGAKIEIEVTAVIKK
ncbi:MAG: RidA family protein [Alphaproteobacteria bacterium]|nr:RidA family protein [Alphaproteobacteria bacterium]